MATATKKAPKKAVKKDAKATKPAKAVKEKKAPVEKNKDSYSVVDIARMEKVSMKTVYNWIMEEKIKFKKEGRTYVIPKSTYKRPSRSKKAA